MRGSGRCVVAAAMSVVAIATVSGCLGGAPPVPTPWDPGEVPDPSAAITMTPAQRGDCPVDPDQPGVITLVVTTDDDRAPVEVTYPVFRTDGTQLVRRMTQPGPVITVVQADCTQAGDPSWSFVATAEHGPLSCALFIGGVLVADDVRAAEPSEPSGPSEPSEPSEPSADGEVRVECGGYRG